MDLMIPYFLKFLLAPIIAGISLAILNSIVKVKKSFNIKKAILLLLITTVFLVIPVFISMLKHEFVWIGLILTVFSYIIFGVCFVFFQNSKFYKSIGIENKFHTLFYMFIIILLSGWLYYLLFEKISHLSYGVFAMFTLIWFLIPHMYTICLNYFVNIPKSFYKPWETSSITVDNSYWDNIDVFKLIQVTVKIKRSPKDLAYSSFSVKLPLEIPLGSWFDRFVEDQNFRFPNQTITNFVDDKPVGWIFYTNKWFNFPLLTKVLNAEQNGKQNKIKNKQTIYIRRTLLNVKEDE